MKKLNKRILDKCIRMTREYWSEDNRIPEFAVEEFLGKRIDLATEVGKVSWSSVLNLLDGILATRGFNHEASNMEIYLVLRLLGWEVVDEEIEEGESL